MEYIKRKINLREKSESRSILLIGPRQTGKSLYITNGLSDMIAGKWDLLNPRTRRRLEGDPQLLYEEVSALETTEKTLFVIDEIQKVPELLDVVHELIAEKGCRFLLTGSSARRLKKESVNLLGGRASKMTMYPLVYEELRTTGEKSLEDIFCHGMIPAAWQTDDPDGFLYDYVETYLQDEIALEGAVRNLPVFGDFLRVAALSSGEQLNYSKIASDIGMSRQAVTGWYQILEDTLIGYQIEPWKKTVKRKPVSTTKFYMFDVGVVRNLCDMHVPAETQAEYGRFFENLIAMELKAKLDYTRDRRKLTFWRTDKGDEVDFIIGDDIAIEVKTAKKVSAKDKAGLIKIAEEREFRYRIIVCREEVARRSDEGILIMPWKLFLKQLWEGRFD